MRRKPHRPHIEVLFGPTDKGLDEVMVLREGRHTYEQLLDMLYPCQDATDTDEVEGCQNLLNEGLEALTREGFLHAYPVGDASNYLHWWYQLTPTGLAEAQKVQVVQEGFTVWLRTRGTDGHVYQHGDEDE